MTKEEDVVKETLYILNYFNSNFVAKIPNNFLEKLKKIAKTSKINVNIDKSKKLEEQKISEDCKDLISLIYYNYVASKEEKKEILDNWIKNEKKYQNQLNEKYNANDIFKNINNKKNKAINNIEKDNSANLPQIVEEHGFIKNIWKKIKKIFSKD